MNEQFFTLAPVKDTRKLAEWVTEAVDLETVLCPIDPGHQRCGRRLSELTVSLPEGTNSQFVWTWQNELLVRDDVIESMRAAGLTGFSTSPVNLGATKKPHPK